MTARIELRMIHAFFRRHGVYRLLTTLSLAVFLASPAFGQRTRTAEFLVVFEATWSQATHPQGFPFNPHFSPLIGGAHDDQVTFWNVGGLASAGIEQMAELGGTSGLSGEVQTAIAAGHADAVVSGGGLGTSPGSVSLSFAAHEDFPSLTLVSMLAPSPDWFTGVAGLSLVQGGEWIDQLVVPLHLYDAGTDSGATYTAANDETNPADPISQLDAGPFAPPGDVVGTFTITRTAPVPGVAWGARALLALGLTVAAKAAARGRR